jgi:prepilin peptidase CpaA
MLATALLLGLGSWAALTDLRWHKIYNRTTYPGMLIALGLAAARSLAVAANVPSQRLASWDRLLGWQPLSQSLLGLVVCGSLMLVCFVIFGIGGGDVKLMAMMGAFLGWERAIVALLLTFVLGGTIGLILLIWRVGAWQLIGLAVRQVWGLLRWRQWRPVDARQQAALQSPLFLAPSALVAVIVVQFSLLEYLGMRL